MIRVRFTFACFLSATLAFAGPDLAVTGSDTPADLSSRGALAIFRFAQSTGRFAEGRVGNGVSPKDALENMQGYYRSSKRGIDRLGFPSGWKTLVDLVLARPMTAEGGDVLSAANALALTYGRATALDQGLPRRQVAAADFQPSALRRMLVDVAIGGTRDLGPEAQAIGLDHAVRFVAAVSLGEPWAGTSLEARRLLVVADAHKTEQDHARRARILRLTLLSHRDTVIDGRDLVRDAARVSFELQGRHTPAQKARELGAFRGLGQAMVERGSGDGSGVVEEVADLLAACSDWDVNDAWKHLQMGFWRLGGLL